MVGDDFNTKKLHNNGTQILIATSIRQTTTKTKENKNKKANKETNGGVKEYCISVTISTVIKH